MFERFTDRARRVVVYAQEEAGLLKHNYIGTEHILLGLIREGEGVGAKALRELGVDLAMVRSEVEGVIGRGDQGVKIGRHIPFTPRAKKILELALREALKLGHNYIGTEHIVLGVVREGQGVASQILERKGITYETMTTKVVALLKDFTAPVVPPAEGSTLPALGNVTYTDGGEAVLRTAQMGAEAEGGVPVGSHHLLDAMLAIPDTAAYRFLQSKGLSEADAGDDALHDLAGTMDEGIQDRWARKVTVSVDDEGAITIEFVDPSLKEDFLDALRDDRINLKDLAQRFSEATRAVTDAAEDPEDEADEA
jgi:ATP-dependent Clp protease ATP-binding subunit ClpA